jgi:outer membrane protein TolC
MRLHSAPFRIANVGVSRLTFALIVFISPVLAQTAAAPPPAPVTLTLKDALALAEKNDPSVLGAASDALTAAEDRKQAREGMYPSLSGRSEYLGTQGNGKLAESRFVTNDGVHVYRDW